MYTIFFFVFFFFLEMLWKMHPDGLCVTRKCDIPRKSSFSKSIEKPSKNECSRGAHECVRLLKNRKKFKKDIKTSKNIILDGICAYNEVKYRITRVCMFLCHFRLGGVFWKWRIVVPGRWRASYIYPKQRDQGNPCGDVDLTGSGR